jgi:DNA-binding NtrC family response regulator
MAVVLIVEDDVALRILAELVLTDAGYETVSAGTVAEALAMITDAQQQIDLVFTDLGLMEDAEGGLQVGQAAAESRPGLPVVYTTGRGVTDGMMKMFVEPSRFVPKPYTTEQVMVPFAELLRRK